jgi:hypothetical protein
MFFVSCYYCINLLAFLFAHTLSMNTYPIPSNLIHMPQSSVPQCQMNTQAKNKTAHSGFPDKAKTHQSSVEVQQEHTAKAQAKAAHEKAKQNSIQCMAEFKLAALVEDLVDATPCPLFTPKQMSQSQNQAYSGLTPIPATSNVETSDFDRALFEPAKSESSAENDTKSAAESDPPAPPPKKLKSHSTCKATAATTKATKRRKK